MLRNAIDASLIIPAFNIEEYIEDAIESILLQNPRFNEIIIIDDGSNDGTAQIIQKYKSFGIRYHHQENQGLGATRNRGIELANSKYIYFMDGDDILDPGMTSHIQNFLKSDSGPPDIVLFSAVDFYHGTGEECTSSQVFQRKNTGHYQTGLDALRLGLAKNSNPPCAFLYFFRKDIVNNPPALRFLKIIHEDEVFTPNLLIRCEKTIVLDDILYKRRVRPNSIMTSGASSKNVIGYLYAAQNWLDQAASASTRDASQFIDQAHHSYGNAIRYASRAKIGTNVTRRLVRTITPTFSPFVSFDYCIASFSKRIAFNLGSTRRKILSFFS